MAALPIMPVKTDALLGDTGHMSAEEFGAYCRLLFTMWRHGGRLSDNPAELARISGVSLRRWSSLSETIMKPMTVASGQVSQKRLTDTWLKVNEIRKKRAYAATVRHSSKCNAHADAHAEHLDLTWSANQTKSSKSLPYLESPRPKIRESISAGSLASALPTGALTRPPTVEQEAPKRVTEEGRNHLEAIFARNRERKAGGVS